MEYGASLVAVGVFGTKYALPVLLAPLTYEVKAFLEVVVLHLQLHVPWLFLNGNAYAVVPEILK